jgi:protein-disulfide isomerase
MSMADRLNYAKMKVRHQKILLPWYKKWWGVVILILLSLILILIVFSALYVWNQVKEIRQQADSEALAAQTKNYLNLIAGDGSNYYLSTSTNYAVIKSSTASDTPFITVTEFGNFSCYYSAQSAPAVKKMAEEFKDKIKIVYRDYPSQDSIILSLGARCAGEQNKFWEMHDMLFEFQDDLSSLLEESEKRESLLQMAGILQLNIENFTSCLDNKKYLSQVKKDYDDGEKLSIKGTPTWFINGYAITGALNEENFRKLLSGLVK